MVLALQSKQAALHLELPLPATASASAGTWLGRWAGRPPQSPPSVSPQACDSRSGCVLSCVRCREMRTGDRRGNLSVALHCFREVGATASQTLALGSVPWSGPVFSNDAPCSTCSSASPSCLFFFLPPCCFFFMPSCYSEGPPEGAAHATEWPAPPCPCAHLLCPSFPCKQLAAASLAPPLPPAPLPSCPHRSHARSPLPAHLGARPRPSLPIPVCTIRRKKGSLSSKSDRTVTDAVTNV